LTLPINLLYVNPFRSLVQKLIFQYRLAFDTIALCTFGYRFNEFYTDEVHPFRTEMAEFLIESGKRANRLWLENQLRVWSDRQRKENVEAMWSLCDTIVAARKAHPQHDSHDLLDTMLNTVDSETGERMSDENIKSNMITFLVREFSFNRPSRDIRNLHL